MPEDDLVFEFRHPSHPTMRFFQWSGFGCVAAALLFIAVAVAEAATAAWVLGGILLALGVPIAVAATLLVRAWSPVTAIVSRHRVRIAQNGEVISDVLVEALESGGIYDVALYVKRGGHGGDTRGLANALEARLVAGLEGRPVPDAVKRQLASLRA